MPESNNALPDAAQVAAQLAAALDQSASDYAIGGAIALGYWAAPRGTLDVDVTIFLPPDQPSAVVRLLQSIGCTVNAQDATSAITEHGFCQVQFASRRLDVFLPTLSFYDSARARRRRVLLRDQTIQIWDAETLCVFKMMFFRRRDLADVEQILRTQTSQLDRDWVRSQLVQIYGRGDPRLSQWDELVQESAT